MRTLSLLSLVACGGGPTPNPPPAPAAAEAPPAPAPAPPPAATVEGGEVVLQTEAGPVRITPVYHATTRLSIGDQVWWLDPWSKAKLDDAPKADVVLITDNHFDHQDPDALAKVTKEGTKLVAPASVKAGLEGKVAVDHVLANGESVTLGAVTVTAVPMYNLTRGPEEGGVFHDSGRGNGYLLAVGGRRIYFAGDTECTPEMKALTDIDLAFLPMNLPYTMTPEEAAACVNAFGPAVVVPYHYAGSDLAAFEAAVGKDGVTVATLEFYPGGLPW